VKKKAVKRLIRREIKEHIRLWHAEEYHDSATVGPINRDPVEFWPLFRGGKPIEENPVGIRELFEGL
jgi:hypothetical protein